MSEPLISTPDVAADWFALKRSGAMTASELREFQIWLARDASHREAYDDLERMWDIAAAAGTDPDLLALREAELRAHPRGRRAIIAAVAASVAAAAFGGWAAMDRGWIDPAGMFAQPQDQIFETQIGERRVVALADGSEITLDTNTRVRARETGRKRAIQLERGRAYFHVARDRSRPFVVSAGAKTVTAIGTTFEVRVDQGAMQVALIEGKVRVAQPAGEGAHAQSIDMTPGWRLTARDDMPWTATQIDLNKETSWLSGRLTFLYDPMESVVAELNRYSTRKIVIGDEAIARKPIVGVVPAGDVEAFVDLVKAYKLARAKVNEDGSVVLLSP